MILSMVVLNGAKCSCSLEVRGGVTGADESVLSQVFAVGERFWLKVWGEGELPRNIARLQCE